MASRQRAEVTMSDASELRTKKLQLNNGTGQIPALGFGTLIADPATTITATRAALDAGFRHFDCAERYRNEREVGVALQAGLAAGDEQDPRDQDGNVLYDQDVTLLDTWKALESLVDRGKCRAIGLSDITLKALLPVYEAARIKPAVVQVEAHPYLPEPELLEFCKLKGIVFLAFAPLGHGNTKGPLTDPVVVEIAARVARTPAQVLLAWAVQRGTAVLTTTKTAARAPENFNISALPEDAFEAIDRIETRHRLNSVVSTGIPGFIPQGN
jgi:alcohol dehydrogenase (NADP+)